VSNFLHNLVRRGAGLPLPVAVHPANGPDQMAAPAVASAPLDDHGQDSSAEPVRPPEPSVAGSGSARFIEASPAQNPTTIPIRPFAVHTVTADQPSEPQPDPSPAPGSEAHTSSDKARIEPGRTVPSASVAAETLNAQLRQTSPEKMQPEISARFAGGDESRQQAKLIPHVEAAVNLQSPAAPQPALSINEVIQPATKSSAPKQVQLPAMPASPKPAARTKPDQGTPPEQRNIQVKIGRVEIRSNQPAPAAAPARPRNKGGFDDFALARTYLDRNRG
jgi:hypothetical protein